MKAKRRRALRARSLRRVADRSRECSRRALHAVLTRHVQREAPQPQRLDYALPGAQPQLAADMIHLGALRRLERHAGLGKIRAGVLHRFAVEPQRVELVAEVVVAADVVARRGNRALAGRGAGPELPPGGAAGSAPGLDRGVGAFEKDHQVAFDLDAAEAVQVAQMQRRIADHMHIARGRGYGRQARSSPALLHPGDQAYPAPGSASIMVRSSHDRARLPRLKGLTVWSVLRTCVPLLSGAKGNSNHRVHIASE